MDHYLTVQDIALRLEVTVDTVRRWLRKGVLKGKALGRAGYRIDVNDFQDFMHQHHSSPPSPEPEIPPTEEQGTEVGQQDLFSQQINADLVEFSCDAILVRDSMSTVVAWNKGAERLYGWSPEEAKGHVTHQLLQTRFPISRESVDLELINKGIWEGELRHTCRDGRQVVVMSRQKLLRTETGLPQAILEINRDITEQKLTEEALRFLSEAGQILSSSLDVEQIFKQVASLAIPYLADFCFFDLLQPDGTLQRVAWEGRNETPQIDFKQTIQFVPGSEACNHPVIQALNQRNPVVISFTDESVMREIALSESHFQFINQQLELVSLMSIPLVVQQRVLGVLTFFTTSYSGRHYGQHDVELASVLGTRAALAVDNARLYQAAQEEISKRKKAEDERNTILLRERAILAATTQAKMEAERARKRLYSLFQQAPALICLLRGPEHIFELANPIYLQVVGRDDILGKPIREALPELKDQGFFELLDTVYQTGQEYKDDEIKVVLDPDGTGKMEDHFMNFVYQPSYNIEGEVDGILVHAVDITDQVRARKDLDRLFTVSLDLLCLANLEGHFLKVNPAFERILGYPQEEFIGRSYVDWVHPDDRERTSQEKERLQNGLPTLYFENRFRCKDGTYKWLAWTSLPVPDEGILYSIGREITEQKELEQRKDNFIGSASHELRTPITAIKGNLQLAERRVKKLMRLANVSPTDRESDIGLVNILIGRALHQIEVQDRLIDDLMDTSRLQADKLTVTFRHCDMVDIVRRAVEDQQMVTPNRTIRLDLDALDEVYVDADADRIAQVVNNYLTNALKYSAMTDPVDVGLVQEDHFVRVWVRDEGPGLSETAQKRVWERFYQVEGVEGHRGLGGAGLGLGLNICQSLVHMHGGEVGIDSTPGNGSTFWFTLPLAQTEDVE
ncbi:MAG TPA: PAS domain S-box protein [Ktedonobacteraceae bacterium]|nr:PAS domain S-box protein [Ktedonobacteraceae bacterium]